MRERTLARADVHLTELAFGAASLGNLYTVTSPEGAADAVATAWELGIRYFDTAPHYGLGLSEQRLGAALSKYPREDVVISTKVGRLLVENENPTEWDSEHFVVPGNLRRQWDFSRDGILRSVEASLSRLGTDYVDILYLHDPEVSGVEGAAEQGAATLIELRDQGVVRAVGIGTNDAAAAAELFLRSDIDTAMLAGRYSLLEQRGADAVFEAAAGRSIVAVGVFNSGILATDSPGPGAYYDYTPAPQDVLERAIRLAELAHAHGATLPQAAMAFPLRNPQVASIAIGMRSAAQVRSNAALLSQPVSAGLWEELADERLIRG